MCVYIYMCVCIYTTMHLVVLRHGVDTELLRVGVCEPSQRTERPFQQKQRVARTWARRCVRGRLVPFAA